MFLKFFQSFVSLTLFSLSLNATEPPFVEPSSLNENGYYNLTTYKLDSDSNKDDIFALFDTLLDTYKIEAKLTAYKTRGGKLIIIGISFEDNNTRSTNLQITTDTGIPELCIIIDNSQNVVAFAGSCDNRDMRRLNRDPELEEQRQQALYERLERLKAQKKQRQEVQEKRKVSLSNPKEELKQSKETELTEQPELIDEQRNELEEKSNLRRSAANERRDELINRRDSLVKTRQALMEKKRVEYRERMDAQRDRKDSLMKDRRVSKSPTNINSNTSSVIQSTSVSNFDKKQQVNNTIQNQRAINELDQENTTAVIESVRKAQTGESPLSTSSNSGNIFFSGEPCTYKVYENRTFVYDGSQNTLLVINAPLGDDPTRGKTILKGVTYDFEFDGLSLSVKNKEGMLINRDGNLLNPLASFERGSLEDSFQMSKEYMITSTSKPYEIRAIIEEMSQRGFELLILENVSSTLGSIDYFAFQINGKTYSFKSAVAIPVLLIQIDEVHKKAQVLTAE